MAPTHTTQNTHTYTHTNTRERKWIFYYNSFAKAFFNCLCIIFHSTLMVHFARCKNRCNCFLSKLSRAETSRKMVPCEKKTCKQNKLKRSLLCNKWHAETWWQLHANRERSMRCWGNVLPSASHSPTYLHFVFNLSVFEKRWKNVMS